MERRVLSIQIAIPRIEDKQDDQDKCIREWYHEHTNVKTCIIRLDE